MIKFIDLFAGIGGFRIGMERNGFTCVYGADNNKHAATTYELNFEDAIHRDITEIDPVDVPDFNILTGGFPCQPFSKAGKLQGFQDTRGTLFFDVCRILEHKKPELVVLENVKNLGTHDKGNTLKTIYAALEDLGYITTHKVLNAADYGVPQSRERIIIVASRKKAFDFDGLTPVDRLSIESILDPNYSGEWVKEDKYTLLPEEDLKPRNSTGLIFSGYMHGNLRVGTNPDNLHHSRVHRQFNRIYSAKGTHPTVSSQEKSGRYYISTLNPSTGEMGVRKLTLDECYKLFGFPEDYKRTGALGEQYARIGNSVSVPLIEQIGAQLAVQGLL